MNVLRQNLSMRLIILLVITSAVSLGFYFLQDTLWAEAIRDAALSEANSGNEAQGSSRSFFFIVLGSLLKATVLIGVPLLVTLMINRLRKKFLSI